MIKQEEKIIPLKTCCFLAFNLGLLVIFNLIGGTTKSPSVVGFKTCEFGYWFFLFLYIPIACIFILIITRRLSKETQEKLECGYVFLRNEIRWNMRNCCKICISGILIGLFAAILGVSGAVVVVPVLLHLKLKSHEASFTANFIAFYSTMSTTLIYLLIGLIRWDYAGISTIFAIAGMLIGLLGFIEYFKKKKMLYMILLVLFGIIVASVIINLYSGITRIHDDDDVKGLDIVGFKSLC